MADKSTSPGRRPVLLSFKFVGTALVGSLTMALVSAFAPAPTQVAVLGALVSILGGLFLSYMDQEADRERRRAEMLERLAVPLTLAPEHELFDQYLALCRTLTDLARQTDPILREYAALRLASLAAQVGALSAGTIEFAGTETWRTVYEKLLQSPDVKEYRSVAWVRARDYWQDQPGRQSMQANFDAVRRGVLVERIVILRDDLWPRGEHLPTDAIRPWLDEQHANGLWLALARESDLLSEPGLVSDSGIYGERAVGTQDLDERARTVRFTLSFDPQAVRLARDRWQRLYLYATPYRTLLDRTESAG
jgi:hypothetical protein